MELKTRQMISIGLAVFGSLGTALTTLLAIQGTKKAEKKVRAFKEEKQIETLEKKEYLKVVLPSYIPTIISGTVTIASSICSLVMSNKVMASLYSTAVVVGQGYNKYKDKVKKVLGIDKHSDILNEIAKDEYEQKKPNNSLKTKDNEEVYWEEHIGFFAATPEQVALAYADLNQRLQCVDNGETYFCAMLYNFVKDHDLRLLEPEKVTNEDLQWGWSSDYLLDNYEYCWVHMHWYDRETEDGSKYKEIIFDEEPILDPGNHGEEFVFHNVIDMDKFVKTVKMENNDEK